MNQQTQFQIAAEQLLNGDFDKVVFFRDMIWKGYKLNTQVANDPDYVCEFSWILHFDWSVQSLAERMERVFNETIEDTDRLNRAAWGGF